LALTIESEREEVVAPRFVLGSGRQHAGSRKARACACARALEHCSGKAAQCEPPRNRQADHACAHNRNIDGGRDLHSMQGM
jgi:hypothetical protein